MINPKTISKTLLAVLLVGAVAFSGCATVKTKTGVERSERAVTSMQDVENDMKQADSQINTTKASLNDLIRVGQSPMSQPSDVKASFKTYSDNVAKMDDLSTKLNKDIDTMNTDANNYFEEWSKQQASYTDPEIQKLSQERSVRLRRSFTNVSASSAGMRGSLNAYLSELKQIQAYLSNDLTAKGIAAIVPTAKAAERDGNNLKLAFNPVHSAIQEAKVEMTPGAAAAGGAAAGGVSTHGTGTAKTPSPAQPSQTR